MKSTLAVVVLAVSSCAGLSSTSALKDSILEYNEAIRWGNLTVAQSFVSPEHANGYIASHRKGRKDLEIADYQIEQTLMETKREPRQARVQVSLQWLRPSEGIVRQTVSEQLWEQRGRDWVLVAEKRTDGDPLNWLP